MSKENFLRVVGDNELRKGYAGFGDISTNNILLRITIDGNIKLLGTSSISSSNINRIYNNNYLSDFFGTGYALLQRQDGSHLEVDNITIRNSLYASIFLVDTIRASNGYLFISDCALVALNLTLTETGSTYALVLNNNTFQLGDLVWYKAKTNNGILGIKGLILSLAVLIVDNLNLKSSYAYQFKSIYGVGTLLSGKTIVRVGNTTNTDRQGAIFFSANGDNTPFMDIYDGVNTFSGSSTSSFASNDKLKVRLGDLNGVVDDLLIPIGYGLYSLNVFLRGSIIANKGKIGNWFILNGNLYTNKNFNSKLYIGQGNFNNSDTTLYIDTDGYFSLKDKLTFNGSTLSIVGKILSNLGSIANWDIILNSLISNLTLLNSLLLYIKFGNLIYIGKDKTSSNYILLIGNEDNFIKYNGKDLIINSYINAKGGYLGLWLISLTSINSNNIILDALRLQITIGNIIGFNSGSGIFIGKDLLNSPSLLEGSLFGDLLNLLGFLGTSSTAYAYSDYKVFIGLSDGNKLLYDGRNVLLTGKITAVLGLIGCWNIGETSIYSGSNSFGYINSIYFGKDGLSLGNTFLVNNNGVLTSSAGKLANWYISLNSIASVNGGGFFTNSVMYFGSQGLSVSDTFKIDPNGNAYLSGTISSSQGKIGGWNLSLTSLYSGSNSFNNANSIYIGTDGISVKDKFYVDNNGNLRATGVITSSQGLIGGWNLSLNKLYSGATSILSDTSSYWTSPTGLPLPINKIEPTISFTIPSGTASTIAGVNLLVYSNLDISVYLGNPFALNLTYHYYNNTLNGKYLIALYQMYQISGSTLINKKTLILQRDSSASGKLKNIGLLYASGLYNENLKFNIRLIIKHPDILLLRIPDIDLISFTQFKATFGMFSPVTLLSLNGLFVFNNPLSYVKVGSRTGVNTVDIKADLMIVKNITVLLGLYTNAPIYGVTLIAGTTANRFIINTDFNSNQSSLILNKSNESYISITATADSKLSFSNLASGNVALTHVTWDGQPINLTNQVSGVLQFSNGGLGFNSIERYKLLGSYENSNTISALSLSDIISNGGNGVSLSTINGILTIGLEQDIRTSSNVKFAGVKVNNVDVVTQDRSITLSAGNQITITGNSSQELSNNLNWAISHSAITTNTYSTTSNNFISDITYNNGHITSITRSTYDNAHVHYINSMSFGIGLNITITTASNSILTMTSGSKTITLDIDTKALSFGDGISSSSTLYNGKTIVSMSHQPIQDGTFNTSSVLASAFLSGMKRDSLGHIYLNSYTDVYTLFSGTNPITFLNGSIGLNYNSTNLTLSGSYLNAIQDIYTGSSPTFKALNLQLESNYVKSNISVDLFGLFYFDNSSKFNNYVVIQNTSLRGIKQYVDAQNNIIFSLI